MVVTRMIIILCTNACIEVHFLVRIIMISIRKRRRRRRRVFTVG